MNPHPRSCPALQHFVAKYPELGDVHKKIGKAVESYGRWTARPIESIKVGISVGAGLETATRSHVRGNAAWRQRSGNRTVRSARLQHHRLAADDCSVDWARQQIDAALENSQSGVRDRNTRI